MFPSFAGERQRRAFWHSNQQKRHSKGSEEEGKAAGDMPLGEGRGRFEGQARGRSSIIGQSGGRGERCPSSSLKKRRRRTRRKDRRERKETRSIEL